MTRAPDSPGLPPVAPMPLAERLRVVREFHTGPAVVRDIAGPVVRVPLGPRLVVPPFVMVTSPQGAHDVLAGSSNDTMDKLTQIHIETRLIGDNVFNLPYQVAAQKFAHFAFLRASQDERGAEEVGVDTWRTQDVSCCP